MGAYVAAGRDVTRYDVRLDGYPREYLSYNIRRSEISLSALDAHGKAASGGPLLTLAPGVPEVIQPLIGEDGAARSHVEFILDSKRAKPGLYTIQFKAAVDAADAETGERLDIRDAVGTVRVYLTPLPDEAPALRPGQRFIGTPWEQTGASTVTPYKDVRSATRLKWRDLAARIAVLARSEPAREGNRLTFTIEGREDEVFIETERKASDLPYLTPLLTEPTVKSLKGEYEGKEVWCYGGPGAQCASGEPGMSVSLSGSLDVPLRIRHVERVYMPLTEMAIGDATFIGGDRQSAFVTHNPLVVVLEAPAKGLEFSALSYVGADDPEKASIEVASDPGAHCLGLWNTVSDRWDFERNYSLSSPYPTWPDEMRKAAQNREVVKGMTHEMVAWALGWPAIYGTKSEMLELDDWTYDNIPFEGHVYFKNGRMSDQHWPRLP